MLKVDWKLLSKIYVIGNKLICCRKRNVLAVMRKLLHFRYVSCVIVLLLLCLIILIINMQELYLMQSDHIASHDRSTESNSPDDKDDNIQHPIVWFYGKKVTLDVYNLSL